MGSGIFGTKATLIADINLISQVVILAILAIGVFQAKARKFQAHHTLMTVAVVANAVLIIAIMNPSFFRILPFALRNPGADKPTVLWPHMLFGAVAELLGVYIVLAANTGRPDKQHFKWLMRITFFLWVLALIAGIVLYFVWYT
ncbi:MAG: DUF420 domain-containing protein [Chloroflexi bacterium]|nr:DUF420 domain-containing protein [Chloroflexota bacterium]